MSAAEQAEELTCKLPKHENLSKVEETEIWFCNS